MREFSTRHHLKHADLAQCGRAPSFQVGRRRFDPGSPLQLPPLGSTRTFCPASAGFFWAIAAVGLMRKIAQSYKTRTAMWLLHHCVGRAMMANGQEGPNLPAVLTNQHLECIMATGDLTLARLREVLHYDPETGVFTAKCKRGSRCLPGQEVGSVSAFGYLMITIDWQRHFAHRLAWFYVHEKWPEQDIDHINRDRLDNRLSNLRPATRQENLRHSSPKSLSGYKGVSRGPRGVGSKFRARIKAKNREIALGWFEDPKDAAKAYDRAALHYFGEFAWLNFPDLIETYKEEACRSAILRTASPARLEPAELPIQ